MKSTFGRPCNLKSSLHLNTNLDDLKDPGRMENQSSRFNVLGDGSLQFRVTSLVQNNARKQVAD